MPFDRDDLPTIMARTQADVELELGVDARLPHSLPAVLGRVLAGVAHGMYGYLDWQARQLLPDTAEAEFLGRHGLLKGVLPSPATFADGPVLFGGVDGTLLPGGVLLQTAAGVEYTTDADATVTGGLAAVNVTAVQAGLAGNAPLGLAVQLVTALAGINSLGSVATPGIIGGLDAETDDALRPQVLAAYREPDQSGAGYDYVGWALEVAGITRAWAVPVYDGPGTVGVYVVLDDQALTPIPDAPTLALVQAALDARRPPGTQGVTALAPTGVAINFDIRLTPDTPALRLAVVAELADLLRRESGPGVTILFSHIYQAIAVTEGLDDFTLLAPTANFTHTAAQIAILGTLTWA